MFNVDECKCERKCICNYWCNKCTCKCLCKCEYKYECICKCPCRCEGTKCPTPYTKASPPENLWTSAKKKVNSVTRSKPGTLRREWVEPSETDRPDMWYRLLSIDREKSQAPPVILKWFHDKGSWSTSSQQPNVHVMECQCNVNVKSSDEQRTASHEQQPASQLHTRCAH